MDTETLIEALRAFFRERGDGVAAAYLFGSRARGTARAGSDIDLALLLTESPSASLHGLPNRIADALERELGEEIQVVALSSAPPDLVHRVLRDGVLVCETDRSARVRFEVARRREYLDLLPVLRRYRRMAPAAEAAK